MEKVKKIIGYCRVSTDAQAEEGYSLEQQETKIRAYFALYNDNMNENDIEIFIDDGYSAKNLSRPKMKLMTEMIVNEEVREVYIYKLDRLSRSVTDTYNLLKLFLDHDCTLISIMDKIDISTANGRMFVGMLAIIAQWERETIGERVVASSIQQATQGLYPYGTKRLGYDIVNKMLVINKDEYKALRLLSDYIIKYNSLFLAVEKMNKENILDRKWTYNQCGLIINDSFYRGILKIKKITFEDHHNPIWTNDEWLNIKRALKRKIVKKELINNYLFRHKVYCSCCGIVSKQSVTNKANGKKYFYYKCPQRCGSINQNNIELSIKLRIIEDFGKVSKSLLKKERKKSEKIKRQKEKLYNEFKNGTVNMLAINDINKKLDAELNLVNNFIEKEVGNAINGYLKANSKQKEYIISEMYSKIIVDYRIKDVISVEKN